MRLYIVAGSMTDDDLKPGFLAEEIDGRISRAFKHAPLVMVVLDKDAHVQSINEAAKAIVGDRCVDSSVLPGQLFNCVNAGVGDGCGTTPGCKGCSIRGAINKAVLDEFLAAAGITTGTASALVLAQEGFVLADGAPIRIRPHVAITNAAATLNVAGTGAKSIINMAGSAILRIAQNAWVTLVYSEPLSAWVLQSDMAQDPTLTSLNMTGNITMNNNYIDGALYR